MDRGYLSPKQTGSTSLLFRHQFNTLRWLTAQRHPKCDVADALWAPDSLGTPTWIVESLKYIAILLPVMTQLLLNVIHDKFMKLSNCIYIVNIYYHELDKPKEFKELRCISMFADRCHWYQLIKGLLLYWMLQTRCSPVS